MKNVTIITNMMSYYRLDLFNELAKSPDYNFHVAFCTAREGNSRIWEFEKNKLGFMHTILKSISFTLPEKGIREKKIVHLPRGIVRCLRLTRPDLIVASEYNPASLIAYFYAKIRNIPFVSWSDGTLRSERFISRYQKWARKLVCSGSQSLIASSTQTREAQISYGARPENIVISYLTLDLKGFSRALANSSKWQSTIPRLLYCGYLLRGKGVNLLIHALHGIEAGFILDIVGSGEEEINLRELVSRLGLTHKVVFHGYKSRSEIAQYYSNADIFVFPTLLDAFGLVLVEALTAGLPIITSRYAGAATDTVKEGVNGYIVDPEDVSEFREHILSLLEDAELRGRMGRSSSRIAAEFSLQKTVTGYRAAIEEALSARPEV